MDVFGKIQELLDKANQEAAAKEKELTTAETEADSIEQMPKAIQALEKAAYEKGVEVGKGMIILPDPEGEDDKLYSQAEVDSIVAKTKEVEQKKADDKSAEVKEAHDEEVAALKEDLELAEGAVEERDQLLKQTADDQEQILAAKEEVTKRLDLLAEEIAK